MKFKSSLGVALIMAAFVAGPAMAADLWLHVKVDGGKQGEQAAINMPLAMVDSLAPMIRGEAHGAGRIHIKDRDYSVAELRRIWRQLEDSPDATYVTVNEADSKVRVAKQGGYLVMESSDRGQGENVQARVPLPVVRALLSGSDDEIDVAAALQALARQGEGELITVTGEETVRMWVDAAPEGR